MKNMVSRVIAATVPVLGASIGVYSEHDGIASVSCSPSALSLFNKQSDKLAERVVEEKALYPSLLSQDTRIPNYGGGCFPPFKYGLVNFFAPNELSMRANNFFPKEPGNITIQSYEDLPLKALATLISDVIDVDVPPTVKGLQPYVNRGDKEAGDIGLFSWVAKTTKEQRQALTELLLNHRPTNDPIPANSSVLIVVPGGA